MRRLFLIPSLFFLILANSFAQADAVINCPASWGPGRYTRVSVEVEFGRSDGFARFVQDFPVGIELVADEIPDGGDFSWDENQLNVVWIHLPSRKKTTFSYYAKPDLSMSGQFDMQGKIVVISENSERTISQTGTIPVKIGGTGGLLPEDLKLRDQGLTRANASNKQEGQKPGNTASVEFRVQVTTSGTNNPEEIRKRLKIDPRIQIMVVKSGQVFKYQAGSFSDYESAKNLLQKLSSEGITDAFIVSYRGDEQIPVSQGTGLKK